MRNVFITIIFASIAHAYPSNAEPIIINGEEMVKQRVEEGACEKSGYEYFEVMKLELRENGKHDYMVRSKEKTYQGVADMSNARDSIARQLREKVKGSVFCFNLE